MRTVDLCRGFVRIKAQPLALLTPLSAVYNCDKVQMSCVGVGKL